MQPVVTIFNKGFDEGDSISHVNEDDHFIKSVGRGDHGAFFKNNQSNSNRDPSMPFLKSLSRPEENERHRTPQPRRDSDLKGDLMWSSGNVRKKTTPLDETIKEDPEENSQPMKLNDKARLYAENSTKDDPSVKISDYQNQKPPQGHYSSDLSGKTTNVHIREKDKTGEVQ